MALENSAPADAAPLTIEQAVAAVTEAPAAEPVTTDTRQVEPETAPADEIAEAEPAAEGEGEAETPNADADAEEVEAATPIDPPQFWKPEDREVFTKAPREVQEAFLRYEAERNVFTSKTAHEAAESRKAADAERAKLVEFNGQLATVLPQAKKTFADKWANVDWVALTDQVGAEQAQKFKFQHDAEKEQLASLEKAQAVTAAAAFETHVKEQAALLPTECPDLVDPKEGPARRQNLAKYLLETNGIPEQAVTGMSAKEASIAWKAYQWDRSQATVKNLAAKPKPIAQQQAKPTASKPAGTANASRSPQSQALVSAQNAFNASPTLENAHRLELAKAR